MLQQAAGSPSFLRLSRSPLHALTTFGLFTYCRWTPGCFHLWATVSNADMNRGLQMSLRLYFQFFCAHVQKQYCWVIL